MLAHGTEALGQFSAAACPTSLDELEKILEKCAAMKIPLVVANPDFVTVEATDLRVMPGTLAAKYEKHGSEVKWIYGKPEKIIHNAAVAMAGTVDACDSIAAGDSLHHDIQGANTARHAFRLVADSVPCMLWKWEGDTDARVIFKHFFVGEGI